MRAVLGDSVVAESDEAVEIGGYAYFPRASVRTELLTVAPKTDDDRACPHGVQFYDVVVDGVRASRAAWSYEAPQPAMEVAEGRIAFWNEVLVG